MSLPSQLLLASPWSKNTLIYVFWTRVFLYVSMTMLIRLIRWRHLQVSSFQSRVYIITMQILGRITPFHTFSVLRYSLLPFFMLFDFCNAVRSKLITIITVWLLWIKPSGLLQFTSNFWSSKFLDIGSNVGRYQPFGFMGKLTEELELSLTSECVYSQRHYASWTTWPLWLA
jgi:hypothetical protein